VDLGLRSVGLAVSDPGGRIASPLRTLAVAAAREAPEAVARAAREVEAEVVVVGFPVGLEGEETRLEVRRARRFAKALRALLTIPVYAVDESFSTREAEERLSGRRSATNPHAAAAAVILQRWLDDPRGGGAGGHHEPA
jgi:putative Holliday junction resolvase